MKIDRDALRQPISESQVEGENLTYDLLFDQIREARRADDPSLPVGVWERDLKKADWERVAQLCMDGLTTRSKDLQLAVWLLEAMVKLEGFSGLRQGLEWLLDLLEGYWETLYPKIERDNPEYRYSLFHWMNNQLIVPMKQIPLTAPDDRDVPQYQFLQWEKALRGIGQSSRENLEVTIVKFNKSMDLTPLHTLESLLTEITDAGDLLTKIKGFLDMRATEMVAAPSFQTMANTINNIQEMIMKVIQNRKPEENSAEQVEQGTSEQQKHQTPAPENVVSSSPMTIHSREEAYRQLDRIADYLLRHEPHSPTPYLLKRIRSWGDMTLFELLGEVASANDEQSRLKELFFLKQSDPDRER